jgi:hypothetical protein
MAAESPRDSICRVISGILARSEERETAVRKGKAGKRSTPQRAPARRLRRRDRALLEAFGVVSANVTVIRGRPAPGFVANFTVIEGSSGPTNVTIITDAEGEPAA